MTAEHRPDTLAVLVHGAWHSSLHWAATQRHLAGHGVATVAVDLPGHGLDAPHPSGYLSPGQPGLTTEKSALAGLTMQDAAAAITDTLVRVRRFHSRVLLVAHSAGGGPASLATEHHPELVDHLVYLSAFVPAARPRFFDYINSDANNGAVTIPPVGDPAELGAVRINPLSQDPDHIATIRQSFLNDLPAETSDSWRRFLHPDLPLAILAEPVPLTLLRWGRIPRTYIRLTDDQALPLGAQDLMITEADAATPDSRFDVRTMVGGHSPFATRPRELADLLASVASVAAST
ncbi:alpha/beta hydrolase [Rhodococcus jostii]|uniref:Alpha/beta fold hydrolase n=1 Tax=Rhodococcus jostii TaxID=132919 RepID=A0ABU4CQJ8_RHOJO|nr:alpha/beta fold hydrolase [Rhodococcus jostii]MDV6285837.1 alpha/beta fold hydrolase [Rhodococcus jostii]